MHIYKIVLLICIYDQNYNIKVFVKFDFQRNIAINDVILAY